MTNTNESSMQKKMREKTRQEHKQAVQDYAKKGFDNGYNLRSYMQMIDVIGGPKDAEEYTEICEDFMEPVSGNIHAEQNLIFVDPIKYKINESQYIRIFKTPLSIDGRLFILVKPKEHKLSKKTYYELAKIAVSAEHYLARANIDDTAGPTYAKQMALVDPEFLEPGKYKEICIYAAKANYRALKWMQYGKLSKQDFIDVFMATATHWHAYKWNGMNPAVFNLLDSDCPYDLRADCYLTYAEKYGFEALEGDYKRFTNGTNVIPNEIDHGMLSDVKYNLGFKEKQKPQERKFTITQNDGPEWFELCAKCEANVEDCPAYKYAKKESCDIINWNTTRITGVDRPIPQNCVDARLPNKADLDACRHKLTGICNSCQFGHNR